MWYQPGKNPSILPSEITDADGQSVTKPSSYPEATLNSWGWFKCPAVLDYDPFYYTHSWTEPNWVYRPFTYTERLAKFKAKRSAFIKLLKSWYRESRYLQITGSNSTRLNAYLTSITNEIARLEGLTYGDASIDDALKDVSNRNTAKATDKSTNADAFTFIKDYHNNSMPVTQIGSIGES